MASEQAEAMKTLFRQRRAMMAELEKPPTLDEMRAGLNGSLQAAPAPEGVSVIDCYAGGVRAYWLVPTGCAMDRVILYVHGGGYVLGSANSHMNMVGHIARAAGCRALNVDYRLAPEHPFPAAVEDAVAAYRWLLAQGIAPEHIAVSGDSAGGGLTLATLLALKRQGLPLPAAAVPLSPWTDLTMSGDSIESRAAVDLIVGNDALGTLSAFYLGEASPKDPLASPLFGDLAGLPPLYIQVGDEEVLLDDARRFAEKARAAGVEVRLDVFPEMQHVFQMSVGVVPEATEAVQRIGEWLRPRLGLA